MSIKDNQIYIDLISTKTFKKSLYDCLTLMTTELCSSYESLDKKDKESDKKDKKSPVITFNKDAKFHIEFLIINYLKHASSITKQLSGLQSREDIVNAIINCNLDQDVGLIKMILSITSNSEKCDKPEQFISLVSIFRQVVNKVIPDVYLAECHAYYLSYFFEMMINNLTGRIIFEKIKTCNVNVLKSVLHNVLTLSKLRININTLSRFNTESDAFVVEYNALLAEKKTTKEPVEKTKPVKQESKSDNEDNEPEQESDNEPEPEPESDNEQEHKSDNESEQEPDNEPEPIKKSKDKDKKEKKSKDDKTDKKSKEKKEKKKEKK